MKAEAIILLVALGLMGCEDSATSASSPPQSKVTYGTVDKN